MERYTMFIDWKTKDIRVNSPHSVQTEHNTNQSPIKIFCGYDKLILNLYGKGKELNS